MPHKEKVWPHRSSQEVKAAGSGRNAGSKLATLATPICLQQEEPRQRVHVPTHTQIPCDPFLAATALETCREIGMFARAEQRPTERQEPGRKSRVHLIVFQLEVTGE